MTASHTYGLDARSRLCLALMTALCLSPLSYASEPISKPEPSLRSHQNYYELCHCFTSDLEMQLTDANEQSAMAFKALDGRTTIRNIISYAINDVPHTQSIEEQKLERYSCSAIPDQDYKLMLTYCADNKPNLKIKTVKKND